MTEFEGFYSIEGNQLLISAQIWDPIAYNIGYYGSTIEIEGVSFSVIKELSSEKYDDGPGSPKSEIILPYDSRQVDAAAGTYEFTYSIENPTSEYSLYADSDESWITDIKVYSGRITYNVLANDSSESRIGYIRLTYGDISESFKIIQQAMDAQEQEYSYTYTFRSGDLGTTGSPKSSVTLAGVTWRFSMKDGGSKFFNFESDGYSRGLQIGKASDPATEVVLSTNDIPGTIKSIKVTTSGANGTDAVLLVTVGGKNFGSKAQLKVEQQEYGFDGSASGEIILKWNATVKAIYLKKIEIEYTY